MKLRIEIRLGNAAMRSGRDVEEALATMCKKWLRSERNLDRLSLAGDICKVRDVNGNAVGTVTLEDDDG